MIGPALGLKSLPLRSRQGAGPFVLIGWRPYPGNPLLWPIPARLPCGKPIPCSTPIHMPGCPTSRGFCETWDSTTANPVVFSFVSFAVKEFRGSVRHRIAAWRQSSVFQPRSGARMQPTAQAVGVKCGNHQAPEGRKNSSSHRLESAVIPAVQPTESASPTPPTPPRLGKTIDGPPLR